MEKVLTYTLTPVEGGGKLIMDDLNALKHMIDDNDISEGQQVEYKLVAEKKYTREELDNMHEFEGF